MAVEFVRAKSVESADKARIEALKERAKTDGTIHKTLLQPEFDRQREEMARRHRVYRAVGPVALVSLAVFLAWVRWLRPGPGEWVGTPRALQSLFGGTLDHPLDVAANGPRAQPGGALRTRSALDAAAARAGAAGARPGRGGRDPRDRKVGSRNR